MRFSPLNTRYSNKFRKTVATTVRPHEFLDGCKMTALLRGVLWSIPLDPPQQQIQQKTIIPIVPIFPIFAKRTIGNIGPGQGAGPWPSIMLLESYRNCSFSLLNTSCSFLDISFSFLNISCSFLNISFSFLDSRFFFLNISSVFLDISVFFLDISLYKFFLPKY